jgi:hypothetical protein
MQLRRQDNVAYAAIADSTAASPGAVVITPSTLADGAAALVDEGNLAYVAQAAFDALDDSTRLRVVQNIGGELVFSAAFTKGAIIKSAAIGGNNTYATVKQFAAAQQQITRIGYNGTTGALPTTTVESSFFIKIRKNDLDAANRSQPNSLFAQFKTDATGSQEELALGLVKNGIKNMSTQPEGNNGYLKFEALCDEAGAAVTAGGALNLIFTEGSTEVKGSANNVQVTNVAVGDCIKIAAALTSPVYKVKSVTAATATTPYIIELTFAYQGADATVAVGTCRRILEAAHIIAEYGVQLRGVASDFDVDAFRNYYANRFTATFSDTSTLNTHVQGAKDGTGMWQQVAMDEYMSMGNQGENDLLAVPPKKRTSSVVTAGQYDCIHISIKEDINGLVSAEKADADILIFLQDGSGSDSGDSIANALNVDTLLT